jgi:hypothetical protein
MILLLLAAQTATPAADDPRFWDDPPTEMIDFLGRRRLCAQLPEPADREAGDRREAERLQCAALPAEERGWRARYAGNAEVLRWIDRDPLGFHLNSILISVWHGPPGALPMRIEQTGVDARSREPYHLVIDAGADGGRFTRITASYADHQPRSFTLENSRLPWLDLQSLQVMLGTPPTPGRLYVRMRYGYPRGYCQINEEDDRPLVQIVFDNNEIRASRSEQPNCQPVTTDLTDAAAR